ncbi:hypothetical protein [Halocatena salina]|uniref:Uncharacterized protein n=1 Tax=Halocatena salina TaxID=2934340 RepID=A0A8U0A6Y1_9EURY|nr:hypothetical protein [Halocatena salina]UPM44940.1 hypothetical protein MW046_17930 [Halocatena salina]
MVLYTDEDSSDELSSVAASAATRDLIWRSGCRLAPIVGGWLMSSLGIWGFYRSGLAAISGGLTFLCAVVHAYGRGVLTG